MGIIIFLVCIPFVLGVVYPLVASLIYPIYRKIGGRMSYEKFMAQL